jgi:hypothetical protein
MTGPQRQLEYCIDRNVFGGGDKVRDNKLYFAIHARPSHKAAAGIISYYREAARRQTYFQSMRHLSLTIKNQSPLKCVHPEAMR